MDNKNIIFIVPSLGTGGAERVVVTLANKFSLRNNVTIITLNNVKTNYFINNNIKLFNINNSKNSSSNFVIALFNNIKTLNRIFKISKDVKPDVIIGFTTTSNIFAIIIALIKGTKSIISERSNPLFYRPNLFWRTLRNFFYPKTDLLIVQTEYSLNYFASIINFKKIQILSNPIDENLFHKKDVGCKKENIILSVGRLDENKNHEMLIRAFGQLPSNNWKLQIVGDGILKEYLSEISKELNIHNRVNLIGNISNIWEYYNKSKIFVFTSRSEGFPNALLEADMFGIPIISTNCESGPSYIIKHNRNGFLIDVDNQKQLEIKLNLLISNENKYLKMLEYSVKNSQKYDPKIILSKWEYKIDKIL